MSVRRAAPAAPARRTAEVDALSDALASCRVATTTAAAAKPLPWSGAAAAALAARGKALATAAKLGGTKTTPLIGVNLRLTPNEIQKGGWLTYAQQDMNRYEMALWFFSCCEMSMKLFVTLASDEEVKRLYEQLVASHALRSAVQIGAKFAGDNAPLVRGAAASTIRSYLKATLLAAKEERQLVESCIATAVNEYVQSMGRQTRPARAAGDHVPDIKRMHTSVFVCLKNATTWLWYDVDFVKKLFGIDSTNFVSIVNVEYFQLTPSIRYGPQSGDPDDVNALEGQARVVVSQTALVHIMNAKLVQFATEVHTIYMTGKELTEDALFTLRIVEFIIRNAPDAIDGLQPDDRTKLVNLLANLWEVSWGKQTKVAHLTAAIMCDLDAAQKFGGGISQRHHEPIAVGRMLTRPAAFFFF